MAHVVDLAEGDARNVETAMETEMETAKSITKVFRWGKEYNKVFVGTGGCTPLEDRQNAEAEEEAHPDIGGEEDGKRAEYKPVLRSEMKFSAHCEKFNYNYLPNLPIYIVRLNEGLNDCGAENNKKKEKFTTVITDTFEICNEIA